MLYFFKFTYEEIDISADILNNELSKIIQSLILQ